MKTATIAPAVIACLMSVVLTNAGPIPSSSTQLEARNVADAGIDALYVRDIEAEIAARAFELERRGNGSSKEKPKKKDSKAMYSVGDNKSETPTGEFRKHTAGRHDDYFADWQTMTGGHGKSAVHNPAAGKGKKSGKRELSSDELLARDLFDEFLEARGNGSSKEKPKKKDSKAMYSVGDNRSETPTGEFRKHTAGRHDDYFADWQTMTGGHGKSAVHNPAAGKGKKSGKRELSSDELLARELFDEFLEARGNGSSKEKPKKKDSKAMYSVGDNRSETPTGEFRKHTAGRHDDYFADWQTMTGGHGKSAVHNPAAGKGKKSGKRELSSDELLARELFDEFLEARGNGSSKEKPKKKDSKAMYSVGDNRSETPTGEFRKHTAGRHDDYFADWQTMTGGHGKSAVHNPAAGKGKKSGKRDLSEDELLARDLFDEFLEARGNGSSKEKPKKKDSKAMYSVGDNRSETPTGEFRKHTAGRHDDYFADWQTMTGGHGKSAVHNPAAGKGKKSGKRELSSDELLARDLFDEFLEARGNGSSKEKPKKKDSKAMYSVGDNRSETPTGEFRKHTAGRHDDYFADWQTMTGGHGKSAVHNPAAGKGKKSGKRDLFEEEFDLD
ncbi:hypothetical protein LshimejAT787_0900630 [Lyophyllum shimeji]|uniref:Uncharacterized protein n=1 Tax=Lyophyllum shimeji TaxID=47721 RepID=A0A9P3PSM6_LYOSH|nr:hypothetical protein LshimejAT787_0900630 [Lyophyllum shimeji]